MPHQLSVDAKTFFPSWAPKNPRGKRGGKKRNKHLEHSFARETVAHADQTCVETAEVSQPKLVLGAWIEWHTNSHGTHLISDVRVLMAKSDVVPTIVRGATVS